VNVQISSTFTLRLSTTAAGLEAAMALPESIKIESDTTEAPNIFLLTNSSTFDFYNLKIILTKR
jgi:hypothetical protein